VVRPLPGSPKGIAIGCGINPFYSDIDTYHMAQCAIDEAVRNVLCVGASFERIALLDNFCWGNPERAEDLAALVRAAEACRDLSIKLKLPFISGKDSFYNEFIHKGKRIAIPQTLLISALSIVEDCAKAVSPEFKEEGNLVYILGITRKELGGSAFARLHGKSGGRVPSVEALRAKQIFHAVSAVTKKGLAVSLHDCSDGGLAVALAEMSLSSDKGVNVFLDEVPLELKLKDHEILFAESPTRFIAEVQKERQKEFENSLKGVPYGLIGCVASEPMLSVFSRNRQVISVTTEGLRKSFKEGFPGIFRYEKRVESIK
jgi:phosphoribosylformylglycinamidine synthase